MLLGNWSFFENPVERWENQKQPRNDLGGDVLFRELVWRAFQDIFRISMVSAHQLSPTRNPAVKEKHIGSPLVLGLPLFFLYVPFLGFPLFFLYWPGRIFPKHFFWKLVIFPKSCRTVGKPKAATQRPREDVLFRELAWRAFQDIFRISMVSVHQLSPTQNPAVKENT